MFYVKKFTLFALISVSISFVLFLFFGSSNPRINSFEITYNGAGGASEPPSMFQKLAGSFSRVLGISVSREEAVGQDTNGSNLTELFGKLMVGKIVEGNPGGPQNIDGEESLVIPKGLNLNDPNLGQAFARFQNQVMSPSVDEGKFNIKETIGKEDLVKYIALLHSSYKNLMENSGFVTKGTDATDGFKNFEIIGRVSADYLKILYSIEVPAVFKEFHKKIVTVTEIQKNIAVVLADHQNDPLKASLVKNLQENLNEQYKKLSGEEIALINKYELSVKVPVYK